MLGAGDFQIEQTAKTFHLWRKQALVEAANAGISGAEVDWLLTEAAGWTTLDRVLNRPPSSPCNLKWLNAIWQKRVGDRVPLQQLLQTVTWRQLKLTVTNAVLIPRPETEMLVDLAIAELQTVPQIGVWADLGTGSGAIAIGLASACPDVSVLAIDASKDALQVAARNVEQHGLKDRVTLMEGHWFVPLQTVLSPGDKLQGMISNPPYIPTQAIEALEPEVRDWEPRMALDGGADGLNDLRHLVRVAPDYLEPGGFWLAEVMQGQAEKVASLLVEDGRYDSVTIHQDLDGVERAVSARKQTC